MSATDQQTEEKYRIKQMLAFSFSEEGMDSKDMKQKTNRSTNTGGSSRLAKRMFNAASVVWKVHG